MAENLLLEYAEGMDAANVGWGRVDLAKLRELLQLHKASEEIERRTSYMPASNLPICSLIFLSRCSRQSEAKPVAGALTKPGDRLLILVGHDTNLANIAGALGLDWLVDGRRNDTPPAAHWFSSYGRSAARRVFRAHLSTRRRPSTRCAMPRRSAFRILPSACRFSCRAVVGDGSCKWINFQQTMRAVTERVFVK